jgi:hypothetical protein
MEAENKLHDLIDAGEYESKDVLVNGKEHTAVWFEGQWFLFPVNFKFGTADFRGHPYLELIDNPPVIPAEQLSALPTWSAEG